MILSFKNRWVFPIWCCLAASTVALPDAKPAAPSSPDSIPFAWFTQIGAWHLEKDSSSGKSFLRHNAKIDGARSGQATANVRLNHQFKNIRNYRARIALGPAPSTAGLLIKNKQVTYSFLVQKGKTSDSLRVLYRRELKTTPLFAARVKLSDTTSLSVLAKGDSLTISTAGTTVSIAKPVDFSSVETVGFECPHGSVRVFEATIEAQNTIYRELFEKPTLVNLHLEKMFPGAKESPKAKRPYRPQ